MVKIDKKVTSNIKNRLEEISTDFEFGIQNFLKRISKVHPTTASEPVLTKQPRKPVNVGESLYFELVEKGNDGIAIIQDGILKFVNQRMEKLTGYKVKDALDKDFSSFVAPEHKNQALKMHKKRLLGKSVPKTYEISLLTKNGNKLPVEVSASLIDYRGEKASMAIIRDISERKQVGEKLQAERNKLESIYKSTQEGLALYDAEGRVVYMNPALEKLFGVRKNIIGVKRSSIVKNRSFYFKYKLERFDNSLQTEKRVYAGKIVSNVLMRVLSKQPKYLEANYVPIKNTTRAVVGMSASFRDVTLLKKQAERIEKQLLETESQKERIQALFENVEEGVHIIDKKMRIIQANSACQIMAGCSEGEMLGNSYYDVFDCHDKLGHRYPEFDPVSKVLLTKEALPYDEHLHTSKEDNKERWVGSSYTPILNKNGEIEQIVSVVRDVTAIKELEKAKSEFVSLASHELRTPLTIINGYVSLLLSGDLGSLEKAAAREQFLLVLRKVQSETNRLTNLVEELLNVSRIEDGRLKLNMKKVDPLEIIEEVGEEMRPLSAMKGIRLNVENGLSVKKDKRLVMADHTRFKEILVNLLDNAIKYTGSGGRILARCEFSDGKVFIEIKDNGIGIEENVLPRVFEKFQQEPGSFLKENKGHGLGLFIVKSLVNMHGGDIWVDSKKGAGTKFRLYLPVADK